ncbi:TraB/GumN family protein [Sphingomonas endophytica]|uniref:TraB/GumN family protein n=1 Tax=Sphingomonas endophytica TaxID=869719 RepID=UPI000B238698|nr:TraB/GumN family protein [Sphingomonas endophytica]
MKIAATALALLLALPACAQQAPASAKGDADPALWVVKDRDTTIYLFGTIHVLKPGLSWFDEAVKTAFDRSQTLVLEMVEPDAATQQKVVAATAFNPGGTPLTAQLSPNYRAAFARAMDEGHVPAEAYNLMRPWFAAVTLSLLPVQKLGYDPANGPEKVLTAAAKKSGKKIVGLETFEGQLHIFDTLPQPAQVQLLESTIDELPKVDATFRALVDAWAAGKPEGVAKEMNDSLKDSPEVTKALLTDRNKRWAAWIAERMKRPGTVFIAVGAGHLAGTGSVQDQLGAYRLKAVRVKY